MQLRRESLPYIVLIMAVFAAYANVYGNGFLLDDLVLAVQNRLLLQWRDLPQLLGHLSLYGTGLPGGFFRPAQEFLFFLVYQVFGFSAAAFHGVNVLLQACAACLVYAFGRRLGCGIFTAFSAALIWGVHPLNTEAITYISGSADPLYVIFTLLGLLSLFPDFAPRNFLKAGAFFILALASKESAVVFPALVVFTLFLVSEERLKPATYIRTWPLWVIMAAYFVLLHIVYGGQGMMAANASGNSLYAHDIAMRVFTSIATLPTYLGLMLWPHNLHMERTFLVYPGVIAFPSVWAGLALVGAALVQMAWGRGKRGLALTWGLLWFAAAFSPYSGVIKPINALIAEHWMYLPCIGLALGFSQTIALCVEKNKSRHLRPGIATAVFFAAAALGVVTFRQNRVWRDPVTFYTHIIDCGVKSGRAYSSFGQYYFDIGAYKKAEEQFQKAVAHPSPLPSLQMTIVHMHLAFIALNVRPNGQGIIGPHEIKQALPDAPHISAAISEFKKTLAIDPDYYWADVFLAEIYNYQGHLSKAGFYLRRAREIRKTGRNINDLL